MKDSDLTAELNRWAAEGSGALNDLLPKVYDELRSLARAHLSRSSSATLQPTVLVHEAYLRLIGHAVEPFADRREFFALSSRLIRHILVDHIRMRQSRKRGGDLSLISMDGAGGEALDRASAEPVVDLLALHQALEHLEAKHPVQARVVELRFFGGLTFPEVAETVGLSLATVERHWSFGRRRLGALLGASEAR